MMASILRPRILFPLVVAVAVGIFLSVASNSLDWSTTTQLVVGGGMAALLGLFGVPLMLLPFGSLRAAPAVDDTTAPVTTHSGTWTRSVADVTRGATTLSEHEVGGVTYVRLVTGEFNKPGSNPTHLVLTSRNTVDAGLTDQEGDTLSSEKAVRAYLARISENADEVSESPRPLSLAQHLPLLSDN